MRAPVSLVWKLALAVCVSLTMVMVLPFHRVREDTAAEASDAPPIIRIHQSDIRGHDPEGELLIRCRFCVGSRKVWHWTDVMRNGHLLDRYRDGADRCPACGGTGVIPAGLVPGVIQVVPDGEKSDYIEARAVPEGEPVRATH